MLFDLLPTFSLCFLNDMEYCYSGAGRQSRLPFFVLVFAVVRKKRANFFQIFSRRSFMFCRAGKTENDNEEKTGKSCPSFFERFVFCFLV